MPFCVSDVRREDVVRSRCSGASPTRAATSRITPRTTGSSGHVPWAWTHQRSSPSTMEPPPSPSSEANGPHSRGTIQTWVIAHSWTLTSGGRHVPSALVSPIIGYTSGMVNDPISGDTLVVLTTMSRCSVTWSACASSRNFGSTAQRRRPRRPNAEYPIWGGVRTIVHIWMISRRSVAHRITRFARVTNRRAVSGPARAGVGLGRNAMAHHFSDCR
jgi:hypothetical protein